MLQLCDVFIWWAVCLTGLLSLGLLLWLHREQGLKVDAYNQSGLTALMVAAQAGDAVMADVSIVHRPIRTKHLVFASNEFVNVVFHLQVLVCLLGADPNKVSVCEKRSTALHFAAEHNHADVIRFASEQTECTGCHKVRISNPSQHKEPFF